MKRYYNERSEKYGYVFSCGELYEFGCSILQDLKSPFNDVFCSFDPLTFKEKEDVARWASGVDDCFYEDLEELKRDFFSWYGVDQRKGDHNEC